MLPLPAIGINHPSNAHVFRGWGSVDVIIHVVQFWRRSYVVLQIKGRSFMRCLLRAGTFGHVLCEGFCGR